MPRSLQPLASLSSRQVSLYGRKATGLAALAQHGLSVPPGFALSTRAADDFFRLALAPEQLPEALIHAPPAAEEQLDAIANRVRSFPIPEMLRVQLREALQKLQDGGAQYLAIRSSSTAEDGMQDSGAGQHQTTLGVAKPADVENAVREIWASLFSPRVFGYLRRQGQTATPSMAIILQALIEPDVAGVLFTANPLTGDAGEILIDASYGLGSTVVDGHVSPDTFRMDKASRVPRDRIIGDKQIERHLENGTIVEREVPARERARLCLTETQVDRLVVLGLRIEKDAGGPRDVEWAFEGEHLHVLQSRPITSAIQPSTKRWDKPNPDRPDRKTMVWSNLNVGEALPGVATPLTWSILSGFSELGFRRAFGSLGCSVPSDAELVGNFRGRIYLNLTEFMSILTQVPGLRPKTLLALGGGGELESIEGSIRHRSPARFLARLPWTVARFARENLRIDEHIEAFELGFAEERKRLRAIDMRLLPSASLARMLNDSARLLDESGAVMLTVYGNLLSSMVVFSAVMRLMVPRGADALGLKLLSGYADIDSAAPGLALWHIAGVAAGDQAAKTMILNTAPDRLSIGALPEGPTQRALLTFLEAYGHRGPREGELMEPRWSEDATVLLATLRLHLSRTDGASPLDQEKRQRKRREAAEAELAAAAPIAALPIIRHLLGLVRRFMRLRERLRGQVTEVLGAYRRIALDASRRLEVRFPGIGPNAGFFLNESELRQVLTGSLDVCTRVGQRRRRYERDRSLPDPPDTFVGYPPPAAPASGDGPMNGLGASAGVVQGYARLIEGPADISAFEAGEILVTSAADVGLSPIFLAAGGVITDLGGPLSHASIVLREYGVPAVVNVKVATRRIKTGDFVEVDGNSGSVRILRSAENPENPENPAAEADR